MSRQLERIRLGVNVDHVATVRQARRAREPDPVTAAAVAELAGADQITVHLREDRRHIQDRDLRVLRETVRTQLNLELAAEDEVVGIALEVRPEHATFVPERREEVTTEGGLDVRGGLARLRDVTARLQEAGIGVAMFIDPDPDQIEASAAAGARAVEIHTGAYANASTDAEVAAQLEAQRRAFQLAAEAGLAVHAGHGLDYWNVSAICALPGLEEVNIGHSIIARAMIVGLDRAVREMKALLDRG